MKKIIYLFTIIIMMVFASCSNDDKNETAMTSSIIGKWKVEKYSDPENYEPCDYLGWVIFNENGTYSEYDECRNVTVGGTWSISGDNFIVTSDEFPIPLSAKIISLTETTWVSRSSILGQTNDITYKKYNNSEIPPVTTIPPETTIPPITEAPLPTKMSDYFEYTLNDKKTIVTEFPVENGFEEQNCNDLFYHQIVMGQNTYQSSLPTFITVDKFKVSLLYMKSKKDADKLVLSSPSVITSIKRGWNIPTKVCGNNFDLNIEFGDRPLDESYVNKSVIDRVSFTKKTGVNYSYYIEGHFDVRFKSPYQSSMETTTIKGKYKIFIFPNDY